MDEEMYNLIINAKKLPSMGKSIRTDNKTVFDNVRKRLNLSKKQLNNRKIKEVIHFINKKLTEYIFDNPEGIIIETGGRLHGVFAISKHMPKEMRANKFQKLEDITNFDIPQWRKNVLLKRYSTNVERRRDRNGKDPGYLNLHSMFYTYRFMWFNHRNCKIKKAKAYTFQACSATLRKLCRLIKDEKRDYYELNFNDFYRYKLKPIL